MKRFIDDIAWFSSVIITNQIPDSLELDPFELRGISIEGDSITIRLRYWGGCEGHDMQVFMSPPAFAESNPVQADLYIRHSANGDPCRSLIEKELKFSVLAIGQLYHGMYGRYDPIRINVHYYKGGPGMIKYDIYYPGVLP